MTHSSTDPAEFPVPTVSSSLIRRRSRQRWEEAGRGPTSGELTAFHVPCLLRRVCTRCEYSSFLLIFSPFQGKGEGNVIGVRVAMRDLPVPRMSLRDSLILSRSFFIELGCHGTSWRSPRALSWVWCSFLWAEWAWCGGCRNRGFVASGSGDKSADGGARGSELRGLRTSKTIPPMVARIHGWILCYTIAVYTWSCFASAH